MGHNCVVSSHSKSTRIPWVDGLSMGPPDLGCHSRLIATSYCLSSCCDALFMRAIQTSKDDLINQRYQIMVVGMLKN